jgi:hypothetical protein
MSRIFESKGIAEPSLIFVDFILKEFEKKLGEFISLDSEKMEVSNTYDEKDLSILISNWYWKDFPISSMDIKFMMSGMDEKDFMKKFPSKKSPIKKMFRTGGGCYTIGPEEDGGSYTKKNEWGDISIHLSLELDLYIIKGLSNVEKIMIDVESLVLHELNHGYESWKRFEKEKGQKSIDLTYALDIKPKRVSKDIFKYWSDSIAFYLYWSEEHEIRAMVQDSLPYVKKYGVEKMKKECPSWDASSDMIKFKSDKFKSEISDLIRLKYGNKANPDTLLSRMKDSLANKLIEERELSKESKIDSPSILGEKIKSMSLDKFLEFSQRRINSAGEKLRRRILRLYSLKNKETDEIIF